MIWSVVALVMVLGVVAGALALRRRASTSLAEADPWFTAGVVLTGAGVTLAATVGSITYLVMAGGLLVMAVGARRTGGQRQG